MVFSRYIKFSAGVVFSFILSFNSFAMQSYGLGNHSLSYAQTQEQLRIEQYQHVRDYHDLYRLFNENTANLGAWGYDDTFPLGSQIKVARWHDHLAGFIIYAQQENEGYINYVAVDQQIRSNGLGRILLNDAINDLKQQGAHSVSLNVYEHNTKAQSLYERLGFFMLTMHNGLLGYRLNFA